MVQYKKFKLDSLFDIQKVQGINKSGLTQPSDSECYDYITRTSKNNGIESHTGLVESRELNEAGTFSLGLLQMTFFYRDKPWYAGQFVRKIVPKRLMTKEQLLYFLGVFQALRPLLSSVLVRKVDETFSNAKIELPVTPEGDPDFKYMTMRIRELEAERIRELEAYLRVTGLDDTTLSASEAQALTQKVQWKKFRIGDVFDKKTVKGYPKKIEDLTSVKDGYHTFGQNIYYQHSQRIKMPDKYLFKVTRPILAYASSTGSVGMINESFYRSGDNGAFQALLPKFNDERATTMLFILVIMKRVFAQFNYNTNVRGILDIDIELPVNSTGEIDFDYMQNYICAMEKQTIKGAVEYKDRVIEETKKVVNE